MKTKDDVNAILVLHRKGVTSSAIARVLGFSRHTVIRYIRQGEWRPIRSPKGKLYGLEHWLAIQFFLHGGNTEAVRKELLHKKGIEVSLRTVQRAVAPLRSESRN